LRSRNWSSPALRDLRWARSEIPRFAFVDRTSFNLKLRCSPVARLILKLTKNSFTLGILGTLEHFRHSKADRVMKPPRGRIKAGYSGPALFTFICTHPFCKYLCEFKIIPKNKNSLHLTTLTMVIVSPSSTSEPAPCLTRG
jgi:hypothetical protein